MSNGKGLSFLGQVDLAKIEDARLPRAGYLYFFF
jgi:uncharacterized protein YwqG